MRIPQLRLVNKTSKLLRSYSLCVIAICIHVTLATIAAAQENPGMSHQEAPHEMPGGSKGMEMSEDRDALMGGFMLYLNQFMVYSNTSGPRGDSRLTGPGTFMLMYDKEFSPENHFSVRVMGSPEQLTVGDKGTPQLFQTENIDSFHPHDTLMALEFRDAITLGTDGTHNLTFLFAPRGEAAIGPVPFMHRETAEGNPDAPLGHALQDAFHDVSTVYGAEYRIARTTIETTAFSGQEISGPFPLHDPDSFGVRLNQGIGDHVIVGASYGDALLPEDVGDSIHHRFLSVWLTTSHRVGENTVKSAIIWGQDRAGHDQTLNSYLAEALYQRGSNKFFGRAELLQITPGQLDLELNNEDPQWVEAITIGYERTLFEKRGFLLFGGVSYTQNFEPEDFRYAYGSDPRGIKVYFRTNLKYPQGSMK